jgi:hypothetical protein
VEIFVEFKIELIMMQLYLGDQLVVRGGGGHHCVRPDMAAGQWSDI